MSIVMSVNAGSSSLKFQVFKMPEEEVLAQGNVERIGLNDSIFGMKANGEKIEEILDIKDGDGGVTDVYIRYLGACSGCASSSTGTLFAIEAVLQEKLSKNIRILPI